MYSTNYFRQKRCKEGNSEMKVPIRWMPLESIEEGLYTEKSDVVRSSTQITLSLVMGGGGCMGEGERIHDMLYQVGWHPTF